MESELTQTRTKLRLESTKLQTVSNSNAKLHKDLAETQDMMRSMAQEAATTRDAYLSTAGQDITIITWECECDQSWAPFDSSIADQFETKFQTDKDSTVDFTRSGISYRASFAGMTQIRTDGRYNTTRSIRRSAHTAPAAPAAGGGSAAPHPFTAGEKLTITHSGEVAAGGNDEQLQTMFHFASSQFHHQCSAAGGSRGMLLGPGGGVRIQHIDRVEYFGYENSQMRASFDEYLLAHPDEEVVWTFHGTADSNVEAIMSDGFKIGGRDTGVGVVNGASYGFGVYTDVNGPAALNYGHGRVVIMAKGVGGRRVGSRPGWRIFDTKEQIVPCFAIWLQ